MEVEGDMVREWVGETAAMISSSEGRGTDMLDDGGIA